jgi:predicted dehydrogenase
MAAPVRVGVIGAGAFGERHVRAFARLPDVDLVGVVDCDAGRARAVAQRFGVRRWFDNAAALLDVCRPHGVSVVTSGSHHRAPTLEALRRGCSVLLEKPIAISSEEVAAIEAAAEASAGFVMPAHILRFTAPHIELRGRLAEGAIGELVGLSAVRSRGRGHARLFPDVHPALMTMIHDLDLAVWLSGARGVRVAAHAGARFEDGRPGMLFATVEATDGSVWSLRANWLLPDEAIPTDRLEVYGTGGVLLLDLQPTVTLLGTTVEHVDHELTPDAHPGALEAEVAHFCTCLRDRVEPTAVTLDEAAHGIRLAEAIIESAAADGRTVDLAEQ